MSSVSRFMFGIGAVVKHPTEDKVLLLKRSSEHSDFNQEKWEFVYGRKHELEEVYDVVFREIYEETSLKDVEIQHVLRFWHFFRGVRAPENEILGLTFLCQAKSAVIKLSSEHSEYKWATYEEARKLLSVKGHMLDLECAETFNIEKSVALSNTQEKFV